MMTRCYNKNSRNYKYYGAKGISVCDENGKNRYTGISKNLIDAVKMRNDYIIKNKLGNEVNDID